LLSIASFGTAVDGALLIVDYAGKVMEVVHQLGSALLLLGRWHRHRQPTPAD
jgi:hypothetical protein